MISKILIANRGEIAVRIIRSTRELGIKSVVVYSEADKDSLAVRIADFAVKIGPSSVENSYLFYQNILSAALATGSDAIHPGYGFLAENPSFAEACRALNVKFIGPNSLAIRKMGDKTSAREMMKSAGIPIVPGSDKPENSLESIRITVERTGFPVIIKAAAGGGGKGMRIVNESCELENSYNIAMSEAQKAFGDSRVYVEKFINSSKHIEFQILSDQHGNTVHLFERDCSIQRRHQKLIEEAPSTVLDNKKRIEIGEIAVKAAEAVSYDSAGTVEFLYDTSSDDFYFLEMNTRIQVEHPITESITGIDIVKEQIKISDGEKLSFSQKDVQCKGHAIECRINAEDHEDNFKPVPGEISQYIVPGGPGIRIDSGVYPGYSIPPYYDSMIAKIISHGENRKEAIEKMNRALGEFIIEGIKTTIPFHQKVLRHKYFLNGSYTTDFIDQFIN